MAKSQRRGTQFNFVAQEEDTTSGVIQGKMPELGLISMTSCTPQQKLGWVLASLTHPKAGFHYIHPQGRKSKFKWKRIQLDTGKSDWMRKVVTSSNRLPTGLLLFSNLTHPRILERKAGLSPRIGSRNALPGLQWVPIPSTRHSWNWEYQ